MEITEKYVDESSLKNKKRVIHYIHLKMLYLAGMYKYEKNKVLALNAWNIFLQKESPSFFKKGIYYLLYRYIGLGGREGGHCYGGCFRIKQFQKKLQSRPGKI